MTADSGGSDVQTLRVRHASSLRRSADGGRDLRLATSGGRSTAGTTHPHFFSGTLGHPEQAAVAMLVVARTARTRFWTPPGMVAAAVAAADPVVTSSDGVLRMESFSLCCGVHARLDLLPGSLGGSARASGTTNVDLDPATRQALAGVVGGEPLHLDVGVDELVLSTLDGTWTQRRVVLPDRWLTGFGEVQLVGATTSLRLELDGPGARRFVAGLPRGTSKAPAWVVPGPAGARISSRPVPGAVCASAPERLRVLDPLLRFVRGLRAYGPPVGPGSGPVTSAWEVLLDDARLVVQLSPEASRGFSGEGGVLLRLADERAEADAGRLADAVAWQPEIDPAALAAEAGLDVPRVLAALDHLAAAGRVGFDVVAGRWFHRELPYDPERLRRTHPRLVAARGLVEAGAVRLVPGGADVTSGDVVHRVRPAGPLTRCTCPWWGRHRGERGPCRHVLAAHLAGVPGVA